MCHTTTYLLLYRILFVCVCFGLFFCFFFASIDSMITNPYHCPSNCPRELGRILWSVVFIIHTNTSGCQLWNEFDGYILWHFSLESKYIDCKFPLFLLMFIGEVFELHPFVCVSDIIFIVPYMTWSFMSFVLLPGHFLVYIDIYYICYCLPDKWYHVQKVIDTIQFNTKKKKSTKKQKKVLGIVKENDVQ